MANQFNRRGVSYNPKIYVPYWFEVSVFLISYIGRSFIFTNSVQVLDVNFLPFYFRKKNYCYMKTVSRISLSETINTQPYQDILGKSESKPYSLLALPIHLVSKYGLQPHLPSYISTRLRRVVDCL